MFDDFEEDDPPSPETVAQYERVGRWVIAAGVAALLLILGIIVWL